MEHNPNLMTPAPMQKVQSSLLKTEFLPSSLGSQVEYREMDEVPLREIDQLELLNRNLTTLSDLSERLKFIHREVRYLMKI